MLEIAVSKLTFRRLDNTKIIFVFCFGYKSWHFSSQFDLHGLQK